jgi:hypothetical protein
MALGVDFPRQGPEDDPSIPRALATAVSLIAATLLVLWWWW